KRSVYAIGLPDGALAPPLRDELAARDIASFDPAGCGATQIALTEVVLLLGRFFLDPAWDAFASLVRHPYLLDTFHRTIPGFQTTPFLNTLDRFQNEHLPADFETIRTFAQGHNLLESVVPQITDWARRIEEESPLEALLPILSEWFAERTFDNRRADEADFIAAARLLSGLLDSLRRRPHV
ncbi:MAG: hypothetical protein PHG65_00655, partial [Kiritimatiellae bacterium]|nr:hypothetical protein [Kiritimatiellia bacterium]